MGLELLFCIIDGLQLIESGGDGTKNALLGEIIKMLRIPEKEDRQMSLRVVKAFFTTDGFADVLSVLDVGEQTDATYIKGPFAAGPRPDTMGMAFLQTDGGSEIGGEL